MASPVTARRRTAAKKVHAKHSPAKKGLAKGGPARKGASKNGGRRPPAKKNTPVKVVVTDAVMHAVKAVKDAFDKAAHQRKVTGRKSTSKRA